MAGTVRAVGAGLAVIMLAGCGSATQPAGVSRPPAPSPVAEPAATPGGSPTVPPAAAAPRTTWQTPVAPPAVPAPQDVTQGAAREFVPAVPATEPTTVSKLQPALPNLADPFVVAAGYLRQRLTYRFDDLAGYRAALKAPAFTTPTFAARSEPNGPALDRLKTAEETSTVQVGAAELAHEAPHTATTTYVDVACTTNVTYRGGGASTAATWTLRLVQQPVGQWRVDGVLSTS